MVERERQDRKDVQILGETTFKEMGIEPPNDLLNLARDRVTLAASNDKRFAFIHHPFAAKHLVQLLNAVAPFKDQGINGILADLNMPVNAKRAMRRGESIKSSNDVWLHEKHLRDPNISDRYKEFVRSHLKIWLEALESTASEGVFRQLERITFIKNIQEFTSKLFSESLELLNTVREEDREKDYINRYLAGGNRIYQIEQTAFDYKGGTVFEDIIFGQVELLDYESFQTVKAGFDEVPFGRRAELLERFLLQLSTEDRRAFAVEFITRRLGITLADIDNRQVWQARAFKGHQRMEFVNEKTVEISDDEGTKVLTEPNTDSRVYGGFGGKATGYEFSPRYLLFSLYPVIAWKKDKSGQRHFLRQSEVKHDLTNLGFPYAQRGNVKLGEIASCYFCPQITDKWEKQVPLEPLGEDDADDDGLIQQPMKGAQVSVWVSVAHHGTQLLSDENLLFPKIEERIASAL